jgi:hypothetical protein
VGGGSMGDDGPLVGDFVDSPRPGVRDDGDLAGRSLEA